MRFAERARRQNGIRRGALNPGFHLEAGQRVGLFGGSFNPAHEGHHHVAETARRQLGLDLILWLVSPQNPLKSADETTPVEDRSAQLRPFVGREDIISDFETRIGTQFSVDTISTLRQRFPRVHFVWIMGADNLGHFHKWRGWLHIAKMVPIAVVSRPGAINRSRTALAAQRLRAARLSPSKARLLPVVALPAWVYLTAPLHPQSSTEIRRQRRLGP